MVAFTCRISSKLYSNLRSIYCFILILWMKTLRLSNWGTCSRSLSSKWQSQGSHGSRVILHSPGSFHLCFVMLRICFHTNFVCLVWLLSRTNSPESFWGEKKKRESYPLNNLKKLILNTRFTCFCHWPNTNWAWVHLTTWASEAGDLQFNLRV